MRATVATILVLAAALLATAHASERSEVLVARAQVAYQAGRYDEARALFAEAAAADPDDAEARFGLGLALGKLGRWDEAADAFRDAGQRNPALAEAGRGVSVAVAEATKTRGPGQAPRPWGVRGALGMQFDSNVALDPSDPEASGAAVFRGGAHWDARRTERNLLRLDWSTVETVQTNVDDFDFGWNGFRGTASWAAHPAVWLGVQGGYDHYTLGFDAYMQEPWVGPFVNLVEGDRGLTLLTYRRGWQHWFQFPFEHVRNGPANAAGITQAVFLGDPSRWISVGYQYDDELPDEPSGDDYRRHSNQGVLSAGFPVWWQATLELAYIYRRDDYTEPNSFSPTGLDRRDDRFELLGIIRRPLTPWLGLNLYYDGVWNDSNIGLYQYRRQVVGAAVEVTF